MPAESESVAHGYSDLPVSCLSQEYFQPGRDRWVQIFCIDGRGDNPFLNAHYTGDGLDGACRAEQVTGHGFGGTDQHLGGAISEKPGNGRDLAKVAYGGGGSMCVEVVYILLVQAGIFQGSAHGLEGPCPFRVGGGHMIG